MGKNRNIASEEIAVVYHSEKNLPCFHGKRTVGREALTDSLVRPSMSQIIIQQGFLSPCFQPVL